MVNSMQHESFYTSGVFFDQKFGLYVGWTCHAGSYCDCMPITSEEQDVVLFFYGEHHADEGEIIRLRSQGDGAAGLDARMVLRLYQEQGYAFLRQLNGWYHGVLLDKTRKEIAVFNDRYGMQRLYHYADGDSVVFASEAKAALKVRKELRRLDPHGVGEFLSCGAVLENRSLFSQLETLPAASVWRFKNGRLENKEQYFTAADWEGQTPLEEEELQRRLETAMPRVVARFTQSRLPIGVSLSGGYDTRMIMAYLDHQRSKSRCYTFGGMYRDCFDVKIARKVASVCGCDHEVFRLDGNFLSSFPKLAERTVYISDGNLGACNAYELYLNKQARQVAPVRLTGSFGSEVMRGARAFKPMFPTPALIHGDYHKYIDSAIETFTENSKGHNLSFSVFKQAPWYYYNRLAVEQSQVMVRTPFMDNELVGLMYRAQNNRMDRRDLALRLIRHGNPALVSMPTDTGNTSWWRHQVLQFLFKADYCYKSGMPQWLEQMHYLLGPFQPEKLFIGVHRFQHFRVWFRKELSSYVKEIVLDPRTATRPYFNKAFLETMVKRHLKGDRNYTNGIELVLTVELMHRVLLED